MRTDIVIDDGLMAEALKVSGLKTKKEVIELGIKNAYSIETTRRD